MTTANVHPLHRAPRTGEQRTSPAATRTTAPLRVAVHGGDELTRAGLRAVLDALTGVRMRHVDVERPTDLAGTDVVVVVLDAATPYAVDALRRLVARAGVRPVVVVADVGGDAATALVRAGAAAVLRRRDATPEAFAALLRGRDATPPTTTEVTALPALSERERAVLRLLGDGADTREVARHLSYSERTVKVVVQEVTRRLGLRNRTHAVAWAVRHGLI